MSLSLAITDLQNASGATAVVAGNDSGTAVKVYTQQINNTSANASGTWLQSGSGTGNPTLTLSLVPGYYWSYAQGTVSGAPALSPVQYFAATDATQSVATRLMAAIVAEIQSLTMILSPNTHVYSMMVPNLKVANLPCIFVSLDGQREEIRDGVLGRDDVLYPFKIQIVDRNSEDYIAPMATYQLWRQQIRRTFQMQRFLTVPESQSNEVEMLNIVDFNAGGYQFAVLGMRILCTCRETRAT